MDPLSRKLFTSRDARNKLREQGGIMASSPELATTVAKFRDGGPTELQLPRVRAAIQEQGMSYPSYRMLSRGQKQDLGYPVSEIGGQLAFDRFGVGLGIVDPNTRFTPTGPVLPAPAPTNRLSAEELMRTTQPVIIDGMGGTQAVYVDMGSGKIYDPSGQDFNLLLSPEEYMDLESRVNRTLSAEARSETRGLEEAAATAQQELERDPTGETLAAAAAARAAAAAAAGETAPEVERSEVERVLSRPSGSFTTRDILAEEGPGATGLSGKAVAPAPASAPAEDAATEPDAEIIKDPDISKKPASDPASTGAAIGSGDFDTTYEQMLSRLEGVMGKEADEDKRKKAMANLAMIGLAIAAGQSPNALTNIAQGTLTGMQGIEKAAAAEKAGEREIRLEAMRMAANEVELNKRLQNALDVANARGAGGGTYTPERLYQQNMDAILKNPDMFDVFTGEVVDPLKVRDLASQLAQNGMSVGGATTEFTPGQQVVQNGVTYEYQEDGTWQPVGE